ncbi:MAG: integral membrane sensor hybrid histidine kinase, partial [Xanthobacteraceae bacterium]
MPTPCRALGEVPSDARYDTAILDLRLGQETLAEALRTLGDRVRRTVLLVRPSERSAVSAWREKGIGGWLVSPVREASLLLQMRPKAAPDAGDTSVESVRASHPAPAGAAITVLIAEDNDINALLCRRLVEKLGHRPIWVKDGRAAVAAALDPAAGVDLVLMDMQMPECDGLSAAKMIR